MTHVEIAERVKELRSEAKQISAFVTKLTEQRETIEFYARHGNPVDQKNLTWIDAELARYGSRQTEIAQEVERLKREKGQIG